MRRISNVYLFLLFAAVGTIAQTQPDILATATGHTFAKSDLTPNAQRAITEVPAMIAETRKNLLEQMVDDELLAADAKERGITAEKLRADVRAKIAEPTEAEIKSIYEANLEALGNKPLDEVRKTIVSYLKRGVEQKELQKIADSLKTKFKIVAGKDVNAANLKPGDTLVTVNGKAITEQSFEDKNRVVIYDMRADASDVVMNELNEIIYSTLVLDEAKALNMDPGALVAKEMTGKMRDQSDEARTEAEGAFRKRLFDKYAVKILYKEPEPIVQNITIDGAPANGPANAPLTVVMFSDFQCPACSATHPILKKVLAEYAGKVRFVVRNYPLTTLHENAFRAALAAAAANAQGKFFEYTEVLYKNQLALDGASLRKYAADLGLNVKQFELDLNAEKTAEIVRKDMADGERYGISGTPTIYVNGIIVRDLSAGGFRQAFERALKK